MDKVEIKKRYEELVNGIESAKMYDGRGTIDVYICHHCGKVILTTYKDKGVTPFTIRCDCGCTMYHERTYKKERCTSDDRIMEWVRPTLEQLMNMSDAEIEHVLNGGLILNKNGNEK